jgi:hypothetical protein
VVGPSRDVSYRSRCPTKIDCRIRHSTLYAEQGRAGLADCSCPVVVFLPSLAKIVQTRPPSNSTHHDNGDQAPANMLRRPPTVISLTENDLQFHLQRIFARSLPVNIDQLSLEDTDENCADQDPPFGDQQSSNNYSASQLNPHRPLHRANEGSSCMTRASLTEARTHSAALPAATRNGSTHRTIVDPNGAPTNTATTAQLISSNLPQTRASRLRELLPSPPRTELTIPPQEFLDPHILPSPDRKKGRSAVPNSQR